MAAIFDGSLDFQINFEMRPKKDITALFNFSHLF